MVVGALVGCGIIEKITKELSSIETTKASQVPSETQQALDPPSGKVLASETTLGRCTLVVVDNACVTTTKPGVCDADPKGYKVLIQNQCDAVVEVRNEGLKNGEWVARLGEKKTIKPGGSYGLGMAATHANGVRLVCP
jgi:hypothetical protein